MSCAGVRLESNEAFTLVVDPSDTHSPKLSQLTGEHLLSMNPNANKVPFTASETRKASLGKLVCTLRGMPGGLATTRMLGSVNAGSCSFMCLREAISLEKCKGGCCSE